VSRKVSSGWTNSTRNNDDDTPELWGATRFVFAVYTSLDSHSCDQWKCDDVFKQNSQPIDSRCHSDRGCLYSVGSNNLLTVHVDLNPGATVSLDKLATTGDFPGRDCRGADVPTYYWQDPSVCLSPPWIDDTGEWTDTISGLGQLSGHWQGNLFTGVVNLTFNHPGRFHLVLNADDQASVGKLAPFPLPTITVAPGQVSTSQSRIKRIECTMDTCPGKRDLWWQVPTWGAPDFPALSHGDYSLQLDGNTFGFQVLSLDMTKSPAAVMGACTTRLTNFADSVNINLAGSFM
jgi:hypothetical protein